MESAGLRLGVTHTRDFPICRHLEKASFPRGSKVPEGEMDSEQLCTKVLLFH